MANMYDLSGKAIVVTGGAGNIGIAIAQLLATSGATVWIWDVTPVRLEGVHSALVDISDPDQVRAATEGVVTRSSRIDVLVNCVGYLGSLQPFHAHQSSDWRRIIDVNLVATMQVSQTLLPHFRRWRSGRIINMGSLAGKEGLSGLAAYSAASAGVIAFTKALSREVVGEGILVNCIAPGPIDSEMIRGLGPDAVRAMIGDSPMNRLGSTDEVAHLVAWLCSDASKFNTGAVFDMSGGRARY